MDFYALKEYERLLREEGRLINSALAGREEEKVAYLTFDDGPYLSTTPAFLDVLEKYEKAFLRRREEYYRKHNL